MRNEYEKIYEKLTKELFFPALQRVNGTREILAETFAYLGYKIGVEIGTNHGEFAEQILKCNPGLILYCIDPYTPYNEIRSQERQDLLMKEAQERLSPYQAKFIRKESLAAVSEFPDGSLDFVYIDGAHDSENVDKDSRAWYSKVRSGGIFSGHDYFIKGGYSWVQVVPPINKFFLEHPELILHHTLERFPSWFCVKP